MVFASLQGPVLGLVVECVAQNVKRKGAFLVAAPQEVIRSPLARSSAGWLGYVGLGTLEGPLMSIGEHESTESAPLTVNALVLTLLSLCLTLFFFDEKSNDWKNGDV